MLLSEYYKLVKEYKQNEWVIDFDVVEKNVRLENYISAKKAVNIF